MKVRKVAHPTRIGATCRRCPWRGVNEPNWAQLSDRQAHALVRTHVRANAGHVVAISTSQTTTYKAAEAAHA